MVEERRVVTVDGIRSDLKIMVGSFQMKRIEQWFVCELKTLRARDSATTHNVISQSECRPCILPAITQDWYKGCMERRRMRALEGWQWLEIGNWNLMSQHAMVPLLVPQVKRHKPLKSKQST